MPRARAKWEESAKEQADEAKKLSNMNKEERERYNLDKDRQAFEQEKAAFAKKQLETAVAAELLQRKLPAQFAAFLTGSDAEASQKNLEAFDTAFQEAVQAATTANLRGKNRPRQVRAQRATMYRPQTSTPMKRGEKTTAKEE